MLLSRLCEDGNDLQETGSLPALQFFSVGRLKNQPILNYYRIFQSLSSEIIGFSKDFL
jgi:hypothetical protein